MCSCKCFLLLSPDTSFCPLLDAQDGPVLLDLVRACSVLLFLPDRLSLFSFLLLGTSTSDLVREIGTRQGPTWQREISQEANLENDLKILVDLEEKPWRRAHNDQRMETVTRTKPERGALVAKG